GRHRGRARLRTHRLDQRRARRDGRTGRPGAAHRGGTRRRGRPGRPHTPLGEVPMTDIAIIGGGISGLAAAWEAAGRGADVVVLETDRQVGGKLRTTPFAGVDLDEAADAFLARVPEGIELCTELGLDGDFVSPTTGSSFVLTERGLRRLPPEQLLGIPTDL